MHSKKHIERKHSAEKRLEASLLHNTQNNEESAHPLLNNGVQMHFGSYHDPLAANLLTGLRNGEVSEEGVNTNKGQPRDAISYANLKHPCSSRDEECIQHMSCNQLRQPCVRMIQGECTSEIQAKAIHNPICFCRRSILFAACMI